VPGELIPIVAIIAGTCIAIFVPLVRAISRKIELRGQSSLADSEIAARLDRIERAVESIAVEIERVSEGQRFTTRLLSERSPSERGGSD
jgi:hypothetical protein